MLFCLMPGTISKLELLICSKKNQKRRSNPARVKVTIKILTLETKRIQFTLMRSVSQKVPRKSKILIPVTRELSVI